MHKSPRLILTSKPDENEKGTATINLTFLTSFLKILRLYVTIVSPNKFYEGTQCSHKHIKHYMKEQANKRKTKELWNHPCEK